MRFTNKTDEDEYLKARRLTLELLKPTFVLNMAVGAMGSNNSSMRKSGHTRALNAAREINDIIRRHN